MLYHTAAISAVATGKKLLEDPHTLPNAAFGEVEHFSLKRWQSSLALTRYQMVVILISPGGCLNCLLVRDKSFTNASDAMVNPMLESRFPAKSMLSRPQSPYRGHWAFFEESEVHQPFLPPF
jgi:hypothetical protein